MRYNNIFKIPLIVAVVSGISISLKINSGLGFKNNATNSTNCHIIMELQHINDSSVNLRWSKGRRGLNLLSKLQKDQNIGIRAVEDNISEEKGVVMKLIGLYKQMNACIITNDFNLNKVADLQGIIAFKINELTDAV